jgi:hypothetical protein
VDEGKGEGEGGGGPGPFIGLAWRRNSRAFSRELRREKITAGETVSGDVNARKKKI